ncbi:MAG: heat-inducible transcription repressor HrcA [Clostridia bacterium]|nr:heat-inducible transcription repressor HrcA [Clostridia bacterium]
MDNFENLSERKKQILFCAVEDYIKDANPITSAIVQQRHIKNISTATLRNELSALEAMGYLKQLHTSSGRIPTTKAYRLYVNELMGKAKYNQKTLKTVSNLIFKRTDNLMEIVSVIANVVSELTNYPSIVVVNGLDKLIIQNVRIIPLIDGSGLCLITTNTGIINNNIKLPQGINEENCKDASKFLSTKFKNKSIGDMILNISNYEDNFEKEIESFKNIFTNLVNCLEDINGPNKHIYQKGMTKLLNSPDYEDINEARKVFNYLEDTTHVEEIFKNDSNTSDDISFSIGIENKTEELDKCSVIKANYKVDGQHIASIGVIGPERMDYSKIAATLKLIMDEIILLDQLEHKENNDDEK